MAVPAPALPTSPHRQGGAFPARGARSFHRDATNSAKLAGGRRSRKRVTMQMTPKPQQQQRNPRAPQRGREGLSCKFAAVPEGWVRPGGAWASKHPRQLRVSSSLRRGPQPDSPGLRTPEPRGGSSGPGHNRPSGPCPARCPRPGRSPLKQSSRSLARATVGSPSTSWKSAILRRSGTTAVRELATGALPPSPPRPRGERPRPPPALVQSRHGGPCPARRRNAPAGNAARGWAGPRGPRPSGHAHPAAVAPPPRPPQRSCPSGLAGERAGVGLGCPVTASHTRLAGQGWGAATGTQGEAAPRILGAVLGRSGQAS